MINFPVLVRLGAADSAIFAQAKSNGADVRFTKTNGARRPHQIEQWDSAGRKAAVWVLADTVRGNTAIQVLRLHWGKADAPDSSKGTAVFSTANGYVGVWHMNAATGNEADATANGNTAVAAGGAGSGAGQIGSARSLSRNGFQYFTVANHASLNWTAPAFTLSAWVNANDWEGSGRFFQKGQGTDGNASQYGMRENSTNRLALEMNQVHYSGSGSANVPVTGEWALIHARYNGSNRRVYLQGTQLYSADGTGDIIPVADDLDIGRRPDNTNFFNGLRRRAELRADVGPRARFIAYRALNGTTALPQLP
jgi:hypothetical protein